MFALLLVLSIGISRVYLGVHYPSDLLAGYFAGVAWTAFVATGLAAVRYFSEHQRRSSREAS